MQCTRCTKKFDSYDSLRRHSSHAHKISSRELYLEHQLDGKVPTCQCGCGEEVLWSNGKFRDFKKGHSIRLHNPCVWLTDKKEEARKKMSKTNRAQFKSGERQTWNKGLTIETSTIIQEATRKMLEHPERGKKISKALTGKKHSKAHTAKVRKSLKKVWTVEMKESQRQHRARYFKSQAFQNESLLEKRFREALSVNNIPFEHQFNLENFLYDFKIKDTNILIEVDGDFYHCNPKKWNSPQSAVQAQVIKNDKRKNFIAQKNGFLLLRFWEADINANLKGIMRSIQNTISHKPLL